MVFVSIGKESESHSALPTLCNPTDYNNPWNSPGQNTGVGSLSLLQGIFPTQGLNPGLLHCRRILYQLSYQKPCFFWQYNEMSHWGFVWGWHIRQNETKIFTMHDNIGNLYILEAGSKESTRNARDADSIPRLGRLPGKGNSNPGQYSCLGNPKDRGVWWATVPEGAKSQTRLSD